MIAGCCRVRYRRAFWWSGTLQFGKGFLMTTKTTAWGLFLSVFLMMIGVGMIVAVMPRHYVALSGAPHTVGSLAAAFAMTYLMVQLVVGRLADRYGFRRFIIAGYFVCSLAGLCFFFGRDALMLIVGRLIQGVGEAPAWSLAPAILALQTPSRPGRMLGGYSAVLHVGLALGPALGVLSRWCLPEKGVFAIFALLCFCGGLTLMGTLPADTRLPRESFRNPFRQGLVATLSTDRTILATLFGVALYGAGYGAFLTIIPVYLQSDKGFGEIGIGMFFTGFYVAIGLAALLTGALSDRVGRRRFMAPGLILGAVGIAFIPALDGAALAGFLMAAVLALGIFGMLSLAYLNALAAADLKGTLSGCYFLSWGLGMFAGPLVMGGLDAAAGPGAGLQSYGVFTGLYGLVFHRFLSGAPQAEEG